MKEEEFKKYVIEINNNIENLLKDNKEELKFYQLLVNVLNQICEEQNNLEQALDENNKLKIQISAREEVCNRLESNWNKLKEYLNYKSERAVGENEYVYDEIYNEMQEMEQVSDSNEI